MYTTANPISVTKYEAKAPFPDNSGSMEIPSKVIIRYFDPDKFGLFLDDGHDLYELLNDIDIVRWETRQIKLGKNETRSIPTMKLTTSHVTVMSGLKLLVEDLTKKLILFGRTSLLERWVDSQTVAAKKFVKEQWKEQQGAEDVSISEKIRSKLSENSCLAAFILCLFGRKSKAENVPVFLTYYDKEDTSSIISAKQLKSALENRVLHDEMVYTMKKSHEGIKLESLGGTARATMELILGTDTFEVWAARKKSLKQCQSKIYNFVANHDVFSKIVLEDSDSGSYMFFLKEHEDVAVKYKRVGKVAESILAESEKLEVGKQFFMHYYLEYGIIEKLSNVLVLERRYQWVQQHKQDAEEKEKAKKKEEDERMEAQKQEQERAAAAAEEKRDEQKEEEQKRAATAGHAAEQKPTVQQGAMEEEEVQKHAAAEKKESQAQAKAVQKDTTNKQQEENEDEKREFVDIETKTKVQQPNEEQQKFDSAEEEEKDAKKQEEEHSAPEKIIHQEKKELVSMLQECTTGRRTTPRTNAGVRKRSASPNNSQTAKVKAASSKATADTTPPPKKGRASKTAATKRGKGGAGGKRRGGRAGMGAAGNEEGKNPLPPPPTVAVTSTSESLLEKNTVALQETAKVLQGQLQSLVMATTANAEDIKALKEGQQAAETRIRTEIKQNNQMLVGLVGSMMSALPLPRNQSSFFSPSMLQAQQQFSSLPLLLPPPPSAQTMTAPSAAVIQAQQPYQQQQQLRPLQPRDGNNIGSNNMSWWCPSGF